VWKVGLQEVGDGDLCWSTAHAGGRASGTLGRCRLELNWNARVQVRGPNLAQLAIFSESSREKKREVR
jgi:hypothetical protein